MENLCVIEALYVVVHVEEAVEEVVVEAVEEVVEEAVGEQVGENVLKILQFLGPDIISHRQLCHLVSHHRVQLRGIQMTVERVHFSMQCLQMIYGISLSLKQTGTMTNRPWLILISIRRNGALLPERKWKLLSELLSTWE